MASACKTRRFRLGIHATNIMAGGGVTHLTALLQAFVREWPNDLAGITVFCRADVAAQLPSDQRIVPCTRLAFRNGALAMISGVFAFARREVADCDVILNVGPAFCFAGRPVVSMCRNMLPFEWREICRFKSSPMLLKLLALRLAHRAIFSWSDGVIFLSEYARRVVAIECGRNLRIVPHGIGEDFVRVGRERVAPGRWGNGPFRVLYISMINFHKNQIPVMHAISRLRKQGRAIEITFVGPAYAPALRRFDEVRRELDPAGEFLRYAGGVPHCDLSEYLRNADAFLFASSCENFPNILVEGMASCLPIACSNLGPMPEIAAESAVYFNPDDPDSIAAGVARLMDEPDLRGRLAANAFARSRNFTWDSTAAKTWQFLRDVASEQGLERSKP